MEVVVTHTGGDRRPVGSLRPPSRRVGGRVGMVRVVGRFADPVTGSGSDPSQTLVEVGISINRD